MTARKPGNRSFTDWIDDQIRDAQERGEFDDLPGKGKPLQGLDGPQDELWWVKQWLAREGVSYLPTPLALRLAGVLARAGAAALTGRTRTGAQLLACDERLQLARQRLAARVEALRLLLRIFRRRILLRWFGGSLSHGDGSFALRFAAGVRAR